MRLHRFYIEQNFEKTFSVTTPDLINQWLRVFRFKTGDRIVVLNGDGFDYVCRFEKLDRKDVELLVEEKIKNVIDPKINLTLCQAIIKKDNFEWVVEKGTELGVSVFQPVISERSEKKNLNVKRLEIIAKEATEQSGRAILPKILQPQALNDVLNDIDTKNALVFDSSGLSFTSQKPSSFINDSLFLFVGPEGGWTEKELELFKSKNIPIFSLGNMTLRAETAAVAIASLILF
jgi:16S rRNA (uracil1498-N3)-methyltransferase